jgi:hypothetical protein
MSKEFQTAVFYFPNWHVDEFNERHHGKNWTEWELLKHATPRFEGNQQPKIPLWGYEDESDPKVMKKKIETAHKYGVDCFLFDWYWFENRSFLSGCLEKGYMNAKNNGDVKFALMYANHENWMNNHPARAHEAPVSHLNCFVDEETFIKATDYCIEKYFSHPSYWRVDGKIFYSIYELNTLIESLGGLEKCKRALDGFRERVRKTGLGELHLNAILFNVRILQNEGILTSPKEQIEYLGFDSTTSYVWTHHQAFDFPKHDYLKVKEKVFEDIKKYDEFSVPYYPNATMGWDPSPRTCQSDIYGDYGYPFTGILEISPEQFEDALISIKKHLETKPQKDRILTINAWNEWTEGSYLEPDSKNGYAYLEAIKKVFG